MGTLPLPLCLFLKPILKFGSVGAALMRFTWANISERRVFVSNVCVTCNSFREFYTLDWSLLSLHRHPEMSHEGGERETFDSSRKIYVTLSSNWTFPYQGGCSQFLISSRKIVSSICGWKNNFCIFLVRNITSFALSLLE